KQANSTRISSLLGACIRLHGALDQFDHWDALIEGEGTHTLMEFRKDLQIKLPGFGAAMRKPASVSRSKRPSFAASAAGEGCCGVALAEALQDGHVFSLEVGHQAVTFMGRSSLMATQSASISLRAAPVFSTSGPDLPTVTAAM